ncbi:MAG: hypothetical protein HFJ27_03260 [Clostridia bacterium]|nr:hypothetical protein [Clostridia bacterium]
MKQNKGITLLALIITIIVLLILAGITINMLVGDRGIFSYAKQGTEETIKAELKTELELKILEIQAEKASKGEEFVREDLKRLSEIGAIVESIGIPAIGEYKDYEFIVDGEYKVEIGGKLTGAKPEIVLTKDTEEVVLKIMLQVNVTTKEGTIESVIKPDGTTTNETSFTYEISENKTYQFIAKGSNGRYGIASIEITNIKETAKEPIIESNFGYPILKRTGIEIDGTTNIVYDEKEGLEHYYSLDNGATWNRYEGAFKIEQEGTIMARTTKNGQVLSEVDKEIKMPDDALPKEAYDGDVSTEVIFNGLQNDAKFYRLKISEEMIGKKCYIYAANKTPGEYIYALLLVEWIFKDGTSQGVFSNTTIENAIDLTLDIPNNVEYLRIGQQPYRAINEIRRTTVPMIETKFGYPIIKDERIEVEEGTIEIQYEEDSLLQHYYSIDNGVTWVLYTGKIEIDSKNFNSKVLAKSVLNGKTIGEISKDILLPSDAIDIVAWDNNVDTSINYSGSGPVTKYMDISPEMQGKTISTLKSMGHFTSHGVIFYNDNNEEISRSIESGNCLRITNKYTIPSGTAKLGFFYSSSHPEDWGNLIEISIIN